MPNVSPQSLCTPPTKSYKFVSANPCKTDAGRINKYDYTGYVRGSFWNFIRFRDFPEALRDAKASHFGRGVCGADGEGKDAAKEPDTQRYAPCLSEPSYRNAAGVISPGLPSQALARQLSQRESPWQRGFVFDETDWGLLENVTECQSLSPWERWHGEAVTERARMLTKSKNTAIQALFVRDIVSLCFRVLFCRACPLRRWRASSPKGRALGKEVRPSCTPPCRGRQADSTPSG